MTTPINTQDFMNQSDQFQRQALEMMRRMLDVLHDISDQLHNAHEHVVRLDGEVDSSRPAQLPKVDDPLLSTQDLAERYKKSAASIRFWRVKGYGPNHAKIGNSIMYRLADVLAWEAEEFVITPTERLGRE